MPIIFADEPDPDSPLYQQDGPRYGKFSTDHARWMEYQQTRQGLREVLSAVEWARASRATLSAHYTPADVAEAMWEGLRAFGFDGGEVLDAGCGAGVFIGTAPGRARVTGVEIDPTTARIAQAIYPHANVLNESFADTDVDMATFDVAIGNVPFADIPFMERRYGATGQSLHNGFIIKQLALTRPGGLVAVITSRWTLDAKDPKAREKMAVYGDLVGAVRLPAGAFRDSAGTSVTADVVVFRRRAEGAEPADTAWLQAPVRDIDGSQHTINAYFDQHPEHVLGKLTTQSSAYGPQVTVTGTPERAAAQLRDALGQIAASAKRAGLGYEPHPDGLDRPPLQVQTARDKHANDYTGRLYQDIEGRIWQHVNGGDPVAVEPADGRVDQLRALMGLRDVAAELRDLDRKGIEDERAERLREQLRIRHASYVSRFGPLSKPRQTRVMTVDGRPTPTAWGWFREDPDAATVLALETWNPIKGEPEPSRVLTERASALRQPLEKTDDPKAALAAVVAATGRVDLREIGRLLDLEPEQARRRLGNEVFTNPITGELELANVYLSGPVRQKLEEARHAAAKDPAYAVNVAALEKVQAPERTIGQFTPELGAHWSPPELVQGFLREYLGDRTLRVTHNERYGWILHAGTVPKAINAAHGVLPDEDAGTKGKSALAIARALLGSGSLTVYHDDGGKNVDEKTTRLVRQKADQMRAAFSEYATATSDRLKLLTESYNRIMNGNVVGNYDGMSPTLRGLTPERTPHWWQLAAAARMQFEPGVILAHEVGLGKTTTLVMGTQALLESGQITKPFVVCPDNVAQHWYDEARLLYPNKDIRLITSASLAGGNRARTLEWLRANRPDLVIFTEPAFVSIKLSPEAQEEYLFRELESLREQIKRERDLSNAFALAALEKRLANAENRIKRNDAPLRKPGEVYWDDLGFDYAVIDEAHRHKGVGFRSKEGGGDAVTIRGIDTHQKLDWMHRRYQGKRPTVTLATGTPLKRSIAEQYTMLALAAPWVLDRYNAGAPDLWAATFGRKVLRVEMAPDGSGLKVVERFAEFTNKLAMKTMWGLVADTKRAVDVGIPRPEVKGGEPRLILVEPTKDQQARMRAFVERGRRIHAGEVTRHEDNMLMVSDEATSVALDPRLVDPDAPAGRKLAKAAELLFERWQRTKDNIYKIPGSNQDHPTPGALQIVFVNEGVPGGTNKGDFNTYEELRRLLVAKGMPAEKIGFVHDYIDTSRPQKLAEFCRKACEGEFNVVIGSTPTMSHGLNFQTRAIALMHLDLDWGASDMEQRNGRILRPGNQNPEIEIDILATKGTMDAWKAGFVAAKAAGLADIQRPHTVDGDTSDVVAEIGDNQFDYETMEAEIGGNPYLGELMRSRRALRDLEIDQHNQAAERVRRAEVLDELRREAADTREAIARREQALPRITNVRDAFTITLDGVRYNDRAAAGQALHRQITSRLLDHQQIGRSPWHVIGSFGGLDVAVCTELTSNGQLQAHVGFPDLRKSEFMLTRDDLQKKRAGAGMLTRLANALDKAPALQEADRNSLPDLDEQIAFLESLQAAADLTPQIEHTRTRTHLLEEIVGAIAERDKHPLLDEADLDPDMPQEDRRKLVERRRLMRLPLQSVVDAAVARLEEFDRDNPAPQQPEQRRQPRAGETSPSPVSAAPAPVAGHDHIPDEAEGTARAEVPADDARAADAASASAPDASPLAEQPTATDTPQPAPEEPAPQQASDSEPPPPQPEGTTPHTKDLGSTPARTADETSAEEGAEDVMAPPPPPSMTPQRRAELIEAMTHLAPAYFHAGAGDPARYAVDAINATLAPGEAKVTREEWDWAEEWARLHPEIADGDRSGITTYYERRRARLKAIRQAAHEDARRISREAHQAWTAGDTDRALELISEGERRHPGNPVWARARNRIEQTHTTATPTAAPQPSSPATSSPPTVTPTDEADVGRAGAAAPTSDRPAVADAEEPVDELSEPLAEPASAPAETTTSATAPQPAPDQLDNGAAAMALPPLTSRNMTLERLSKALRSIGADDVADTLPAVFTALDNPPRQDQWFADVDRAVEAFTRFHDAVHQALPLLPDAGTDERGWLIDLAHGLGIQARDAGYPPLDPNDLAQRAEFADMSDGELRSIRRSISEDHEHHRLLVEMLERRGLDEFGTPASGTPHGLDDAAQFDPSMAGALVRVNAGQGNVVIGTVVQHPSGWWVEGHVEGASEEEQVPLHDRRYGPPHVQVLRTAAERLSESQQPTLDAPHVDDAADMDADGTAASTSAVPEEPALFEIDDVSPAGPAPHQDQAEKDVHPPERELRELAADDNAEQPAPVPSDASATPIRSVGDAGPLGDDASATATRDDNQPAPSSEPASPPTAGFLSADTASPETFAGDQMPAQSTPVAEAPTGPWSARIRIDDAVAEPTVAGTRFEDTQLRAALHSNNFKWRRARQLWEYAGPPAERDSAVAAIRAVVAELDRTAPVRPTPARTEPAQNAPARKSTRSFPPTAQQQAIIDAAVSGQNVAVQALAGAGKTSTLRMIADAMPDKRILYIAFNKDIAKEARGSFRPGVTALTSHSLARRALLAGPYADKIGHIGKGLRHPEQIASLLRLSPIDYIDQDGQPQVLEPSVQAQLAMSVVKKFRESADFEITEAHLPDALIAYPGQHIARAVLTTARRAWNNIADPNNADLLVRDTPGAILFDHDDYLKLYQLSRPRIDADLIFFDEAQDINDVRRHIVQSQPTQTIVVGDSYQAIYEFTGAKDALVDWPADVTLPLTKSWRFGPAIAEAGNDFLRLLGSPHVLEGNPAMDSTIGVVDEPDAILCRTNVGAVSAVLEAMEKGKRVALAGGGAEVSKLAKAAKSLKAGRGTKHPELSRFTRWEQVVKAAEDDRNLQTFVALIENYSPDRLLEMVGRLVDEDATGPGAPDLIVSTAHKAKGREWPNVRIGDDFLAPEYDDSGRIKSLPPVDQLRLSYVAVTRGRNRVDLGSLAWIEDVARGTGISSPTISAGSELQVAADNTSTPQNEPPVAAEPGPAPAAEQETDAPTVSAVDAAPAQLELDEPAVDERAAAQPVEERPQPGAEQPAQLDLLAADDLQQASTQNVSSPSPAVEEQAEQPPASVNGASAPSSEAAPSPGEVGGRRAPTSASPVDAPATGDAPAADSERPDAVQTGGRGPEPWQGPLPEVDLENPDQPLNWPDQRVVGRHGAAPAPEDRFVRWPTPPRDQHPREAPDPSLPDPAEADPANAAPNLRDEHPSALRSRAQDQEEQQEETASLLDPQIDAAFVDAVTALAEQPVDPVDEPTADDQDGADATSDEEGPDPEPSPVYLYPDLNQAFEQVKEALESDGPHDDIIDAIIEAGQRTTDPDRAAPTVSSASPAPSASAPAAAPAQPPAAPAAPAAPQPPTPVEEALKQPLKAAEAALGDQADTQEWQRIKAVIGASRNLGRTLAAAAGSYAREMWGDVRTRGLLRVVAMRGARTIATIAYKLANGLDRGSALAVRALRALSRKARDYADRLAGALPADRTLQSKADLQQSWSDLDQRLDASGKTNASAKPAASGKAAQAIALLESSVAATQKAVATTRNALGELSTAAWQRITAVWNGAAAVVSKVRQGALRFGADTLTLGYFSAVWARTCETLSWGAGQLMEHLERKGAHNTPAWHAARALRHVTEHTVDRLHGVLPPGASVPIGAYDPPSASRPVPEAGQPHPATGSSSTPSASRPAHAQTDQVYDELIAVLDAIDYARRHGELTGGFAQVGALTEQAAAKIGLTRFGEQGETFDPTRHDAVARADGDTSPLHQPIATEVLRPGYAVNGRVLRPAAVVVGEPDGPADAAVAEAQFISAASNQLTYNQAQHATAPGKTGTAISHSAVQHRGSKNSDIER